MAPSEDLINFDVIETHKENIQSLPGGRSAKQLVSILSPLASTKTGSEPTLNETKTLNDAIRYEYETELLSIADSDDPLDIYDRYVKWTLNAYPSAQATPQSQLLPLLERATKTFLTSQHYKNDPRYLKLWLHYIRFFSDNPRETFVFLARHHIGETLGLFYEDFAAWLEGAGRWNQADEVYRMGIEKEARPQERLLRKYNQFQQRFEARSVEPNEPSSPALPTVRPALAAKVDPFAAAPRTESPQSQQAASNSANTKAKSGRVKMAIFNDADSQAPPPGQSTTKGWDSIGSIRERKKENTIEPRPWTGETLKTAKRVGTIPKMEIFKDPKTSNNETPKENIPSKAPDVVNPRTGRKERVFVRLEAVYPNQQKEYSFEELRAMSRGWMDIDWKSKRSQEMDLNEQTSHSLPDHEGEMSTEFINPEELSRDFQEKVNLGDKSTRSVVSKHDSKPAKQKKIRHREVKQEAQTVKTRLDSPSGKKVKRKVAASAEPTMTFHSKAAMNDIYSIFNTSKKETAQSVNHQPGQLGDETDNGEDTHSTFGESVGGGHTSDNNTDAGDDTTKSFGFEMVSSQVDGSSSPWSDLNMDKPMPKSKSQKQRGHRSQTSDDMTEDFNLGRNDTIGGFDTQAIAALANQDFGDLDTKMIAHLAGDIDDDEDEEEKEDVLRTNDEIGPTSKRAIEGSSLQTLDMKTPVEEDFIEVMPFEIHEKPRYVPLPPEDYEPTPLRPYRDPASVAHNKLPFMTPIVERTESSMAPSTVFQNPDNFDIESPSKSTSQSAHTSPSKLRVVDLLLSSPVPDSPSSNRKRKTSVVPVDENLGGSPPKRNTAPSFQETLAVPFPVALGIPAVTAIEPGSDTTTIRDESELIASAQPRKAVTQAKATHKGPVINDMQCNPCDATIRQQILDTTYPAVVTYQGYFDCTDKAFNHHHALKTFAAKQKKDAVKGSPRKTNNEKTLTKAVPPILEFENANRVYAVKKELGKGAYAPVYLVEVYMSDGVSSSSSIVDSKKLPDLRLSTVRGELEAIKTESPPLSLAWEFHILHLVRSRLGNASRTMTTIIKAHECHLYRDECYLVLDYHSQGTILDLVNLVRADNVRAGKVGEGLDETVAAFFAIELLRIMDDLWRVGILHGDLKIDNCLVRLNTDAEITGPYSRSGADGWGEKGFTLIDFGRGIDTKAFKPEAKFVADWKAEETDCAEMREARPWKYEIDLFGAAGVIHSLLFGKYIETVTAGGGGLGQRKEWKLRESLKRYWERDIWTEVFSVLINGGRVQGVDEVRREVGRVRTMLEDWLETEGERGGRDLRSSIRRCERLLMNR